ncbi:MAG: xanthine dehydrogenase family protein molybdopterin-binding subunit [Desulfobacterales bacterium]|nr:MAG: xanthine dehydrogenase family protein molybdopterin-binding subunit [Desulfobacterales bacterium]
MGDYQEREDDGLFRIGADIAAGPFNAIGKRGVRRKDGYEKVSGEAVYTRDVTLPGMLSARVLSSPYARARIIHMDTAKAQRLPGVRAVLRFDDAEVKGRRLNGSYCGPGWIYKDPAPWHMKPVHYVLGDESWYEGQPMGVAVAADTEDIAIQALKLIQIEWQELPFVLDPHAALKPDAPVLRPDAHSNLLEDPRQLLELGDVAKGFQAADTIIEFKARRRPHLWAGAEMPSVLARWRGANLEMWLHQQQPYHAKMLLAEWLNIPMSQIAVHSPYMGCSFGGRGNPADVSENGMNILATLLARKTRKPVKLLYDRRQTFFGESGDMMSAVFKVGAQKDGTITAVDIKCVFAVFMCTPGIEHFIDNTRIPNLRCEALTVDVSKGPAWWHRCEQLPNALCLTLVFDHVAAALGIDPIEVALKNDGYDGRDASHLSQYKKQHGFADRDSLKECSDAGRQAIGWEEKWHPPGTKKLPNGRMHGIAFTWDHAWDDVRGTGSAAVMIENDGTVSIIAQQTDLGVNPWTAYGQIVADELGVPLEDINFKPFTLDHGFALMSPDGSCNLCSNGYTVRKAARQAKKRLLELAAAKFGDVKPEDLDIEERRVYVKAEPARAKTIKEVTARAMPSFVSEGFWPEAPVIAWAWHCQGIFGESIATGRPRLCRQAHFMEIEVDTETGQIEIIKVVNVNDVGKAISPETVEGQMYGGTYMAVGRALTEELVWDPNTGVLLNRNLLDYKYATMNACGPIDTIYLETGLGHGPYGAVGVGEDCATVVPALISPAVYNAIGKWIDDFPITPDKVLKALGKA